MMEKHRQKMWDHFRGPVAAPPISTLRFFEPERAAAMGIKLPKEERETLEAEVPTQNLNRTSGDGNAVGTPQVEETGAVHGPVAPRQRLASLMSRPVSGIVRQGGPNPMRKMMMRT